MAVPDQHGLSDRDPDSTDRSFVAALGIYFGVVIAGWSAIAGLFAGASTAIVLATTPGTVTGVLVVTLLVGDRFTWLAPRVGRNRWRRSVWALPPIAFLAVAVVAMTLGIWPSDRLLLATLAPALVSGAIAIGLAYQCRNRYVDAVTPDEPTATWPWHKTGIANAEWVFAASMAVLIVAGLGMVALGNWFGLFWAGYGLLMTAIAWPNSDTPWFDSQNRWNTPELRVHEVGLVVDKPFGNTIVPWDAIDSVRLTDDELVLERRWLDVRCDRTEIDDSEAVVEAIDAARERRRDRR